MVVLNPVSVCDSTPRVGEGSEGGGGLGEGSDGGGGLADFFLAGIEIDLVFRRLLLLAVSLELRVGAILVGAILVGAILVGAILVGAILV